MLENTAPQSVFRYFEEICAIPHGSGNTAAISDYCIRFAENKGLWCKKDGLNNVIIKKAASAGAETHPPVILQGHLDMVCEKTADCDIDFKKDGLRLRLNGDLLSANGTTLGADDGIAVAMILAILDDDNLEHPPIEAVFTVDEEVGMDGAEGLDTSCLKGSTLINLDSGEENTLTVGCAGGAKAELKIPITLEKNERQCRKILISGLLGGHSGVDINSGRLNADKLLGKLLSDMPFEFRLVSVKGGFKDNVIPNAGECVIASEGDAAEYIKRFVSENTVKTDSGLKVEIDAAETADMCFDRESTARITDFLNSVPSGVAAMSADMPDQVESSQNLGIIETEKNFVRAVLSVRSSVAAEKQKLLDDLDKTAEAFGAEISTHGHYPAWEFRKKSRLRDTMVSVFSRLYGTEPIVKTIHAGLECGLFNEKIKNFDAVSTGPDMWDIHTVNERLSVSSVERTYKYICEVLKEL